MQRTLIRGAEASRRRIVSALGPRGGFLPPVRKGWFELTKQAMAADLAPAPLPEAG